MNNPDIIEAIMSGMDESWNGENSAHSIVVGYVRELERRIVALGGDLKKDPELSDVASETRARFAGKVDDLGEQLAGEATNTLSSRRLMRAMI